MLQQFYATRRYIAHIYNIGCFRTANTTHTNLKRSDSNIYRGCAHALNSFIFESKCWANIYVISTFRRFNSSIWRTIKICINSFQSMTFGIPIRTIFSVAWLNSTVSQPKDDPTNNRPKGKKRALHCDWKTNKKRSCKKLLQKQTKWFVCAILFFFFFYFCRCLYFCFSRTMLHKEHFGVYVKWFPLLFMQRWQLVLSSKFTNEFAYG